jgi:uncharacterized membrane protein YhaH (DUF805 family)
MDDREDSRLLGGLYFFGMLPLTLIFLFFSPLLPILPNGEVSEFGMLLYWASFFIWLLLAAIAVARRHWKATVISSTAVLLSAVPTAGFIVACLNGNCI